MKEQVDEARDKREVEQVGRKRGMTGSTISMKERIKNESYR